MNHPTIERLADLQVMIAAFARVDRALDMPGTDRRENDVDHSYGLALTCLYLQRKIAPKLSLEKILVYALTHDIIELHAGDTFAFDAQAALNKEQREAAALQKIQDDWPDFPALTDGAAGYASRQDAEAAFVYTIDKLLPSILICIGEDKDFFKRHKITRAAHEAEKRKKMQHSPEALPYLDMLNTWMAQQNLFYEADA